jgi:chromate transporter
MQADAVGHHWLTATEFIGAVALGQVTPGPVVKTVAVVGYGAGGLAGGIFASAVAFAPSFAFVLIGGRHFVRLRTNARAQAFLAGAGPAAVGAIVGAAVPLTLALGTWWQVAILGGGGLAIALRQRPVVVIVAGGLCGLAAVALGFSLPG